MGLMAENPLLLQYLQSIQASNARIEEKVDLQAVEIASLRETRAENKGERKAVVFMSGGLAGLITIITNLFMRH
jgi:hypothetical protein